MKKFGLVLVLGATGSAIYYGSLTPKPYEEYRTNLHRLAHHVNMHRKEYVDGPIEAKMGKGTAIVNGRICLQCGHVDVTEMSDNQKSTDTLCKSLNPWTTYEELQWLPPKPTLPN